MEAERESAFKRVGTYDLFACIGQGSFATVYRGQHRTTKRVVAVKAIVRARLNAKLQENLEAEISIMQSLEHPNVVRLFEVQTTERHVYLMLEFCPGGDLMRVIRARGTLDEAQTRVYLQQLALGLGHLRSRNLIHRDLKPQNLLLSSMAPSAVLKIADFGFARYVQQQDLAETLCGSPLYMAPEILRFQKYDAKADLWSVGAILHEMLVGRPPFTGANHVQLLKNIDTREPPNLPDGISADAKTLVGALLQREPFQRLAFEEFFAHPFVSSPPLAAQPSAPAADKPPREERVSAGSDMSLASPAFAPSSPQLPAGAPGGTGIDSAGAGFSLGGIASDGGLQSSPRASPRTVPSSPAPYSQPVQPQPGALLALPAATNAVPAHLPASQPPTEAPSRLGSPLDAPFAAQPPRHAALPSPATAPMASPSPPQSGMLPAPVPHTPMPALHLTAQLQPTPAPARQVGQAASGSAAQEGTVLSISNAVARPVSPPGSTLAACCMGGVSGASANSTARQILPVPIGSGSCGRGGSAPAASAPEMACPIGCGAHGSAAHGAQVSSSSALPIHDASLDGIDQEYVLISTRSLASTLPPASALANAAGCSSGFGTADRSAALSQDAHQRQAAAEQEGQLELAAQLARAAALADLAQESADGGPMAYGEGFTAVEALALHVKALATMQQCLASLQAQPQPQRQPPLLAALQQPRVGGSSEADARLQAIRGRFAELLQSAERIRNSLRYASADSSNPTTVCVEEMLYRHALGMGREAAVDELLGKLASSCVLYARAKLLLEQLALEPQVGDADRAVLCKYAAGFAWRLQEISQKQVGPLP